MQTISNGDMFRRFDLREKNRRPIIKTCKRILRKLFPKTFNHLMLNIFIHDEKKLIFLRNPKAASTTIIATLTDAYPNEWVMKKACWLPFNRKGKMVFTTVRNHDKRVESCYRWFTYLGKLPNGITTINEFKDYTDKHPYQNRHWMPQGGIIKKADIVLSCEKLEKEFSQFCIEHGLDKVSFPLPRYKQTR